MKTLIVAAMVLSLSLPALPAAAQQIEMQTVKPPAERPARVVPPPLRYETTRPPDANNYPMGPRVEHDPAFIEPFATTYENTTTSGRYGLSGWTAPNTPVNTQGSGYNEVTGWFALGFSITWGGPPAKVVPAAKKTTP